MFKPRASCIQIKFLSKMSKPEHVSKQLIRSSYQFVKYEVLQIMGVHITRGQ